MEPEDFQQAAFLALLDALEGLGAGGRGFPYLVRAAAESGVCGGHRTADKQARPPAKLRLPGNADSGGRRADPGDVLPDPAAEQAIADIAERDRRQRLRRALYLALQTLPEAQRRAVVGRYLYGRKTDARACSAGLRALRHPRISRELSAYIT